MFTIPRRSLFDDFPETLPPGIPEGYAGLRPQYAMASAWGDSKLTVRHASRRIAHEERATFREIDGDAACRVAGHMDDSRAAIEIDLIAVDELAIYASRFRGRHVLSYLGVELFLDFG